MSWIHDSVNFTCVRYIAANLFSRDWCGCKVANPRYSCNDPCNLGCKTTWRCLMKIAKYYVLERDIYYDILFTWSQYYSYVELQLGLQNINNTRVLLIFATINATRICVISEKISQDKSQVFTTHGHFQLRPLTPKICKQPFTFRVLSIYILARYISKTRARSKD